MSNGLRKNAIYQTLYQVLITITPLITTPYLARVLGAEGTGEYSFTLTASNYFAMFVMLGVKDYGTRSIAEFSTNQDKKQQIFWEIYMFQFLCGIFATILFFGSCCAIDSLRTKVTVIQGLNIIASCIDINWFFFGIEKFKITVTRNIIIKICTVISIFVFVKGDNGVFIYALIMSLGTLISQVVLWTYLRKEIKFFRPTWNGICSHIKPNLRLFIPVIAENVYHLMDKTMLGSISSYSELGYYYNADKMINIPKGIVNGLGTVFMARIAALSGEKDNKGIKELIGLSFEFHTFICCALAFGIGAVSVEFVPLFFGSGFEPCIDLMYIFCPILMIKSYNIFIETEYFLPMKKEKFYSFAVIVGACVNLILNILLIPRMSSLGASLGTLFAELSVLIVLVISYIRTSHQFSFFGIINTIPYYLCGAVMLFIIRFVSNIGIENSFVLVVLEIGVGGTAYMTLCFIYWSINKHSMFGQHLLSRVRKFIRRIQ